jgi:hypothetical protein
MIVASLFVDMAGWTSLQRIEWVACPCIVVTATMLRLCMPRPPKLPTTQEGVVHHRLLCLKNYQEDLDTQRPIDKLLI